MTNYSIKQQTKSAKHAPKMFVEVTVMFIRPPSYASRWYGIDTLTGLYIMVFIFLKWRWKCILMTVTSKIYIIQENNTNLLVTSVIEQINVVHRLFRRPKKRAGNSTDLKPRFGNPSAGRPRVHTFCKHPFSRQRNNYFTWNNRQN